jgi:hypothetical protein
MNLLEMSTSLAFEALVRRTGARQAVIAKAMGIRESGLSKALHFKKVLRFSEVHLFCQTFEIDISEMSRLTKEFFEKKDLLKRIQKLRKAADKSKTEISNLLESIANESVKPPRT